MNHGSRKPQPTALEIAVVVHLAVFIVGVSWAFGGNADWVRTPISLWGSLGMLLSAGAITVGHQRHRIQSGAIAPAVPIVLLNLMVAGSCLVSGLRTIAFRDQVLLIPVQVPWWIPSAARSGLALRALWIFDGVYFSALNLVLAVRSRHLIRVVLAVAVGNSLALSVFGIVQKLAGYEGIYFGLVRSPQVYFFSTFVYDNHWGAFIVLMMGACMGLGLRYIQGSHDQGFFRGPSFAGFVTAAILTVSIPISGSRACSILAGIMIALTVVKGFPRVSGAFRSSGVSTSAALSGMAIAAVLCVAGLWFVAGDIIQARTNKTKEQVISIWNDRGLGSRGTLYKDTWKMSSDRPLYGWGMGSYPSVFDIYNSQKPNRDGLPQIYHDAHSDWLQSLAEIGFVGTALVGAAVVMPAMAIRRLKVSIIPYFLLCGCVLVGAYSLVEFPFGNVAVVLSWWLCFFSAIQYICLTAKVSESPLES